MLKEILTEKIQTGCYSTWEAFFREETEKHYFQQLDSAVSDFYRNYECFPPKEDIFNAFDLPADKVKVIILGQDPYPTKGMAHGLAFSVKEGHGFPPSLRNIAKEYEDDIGVTLVSTDLSSWARKGIFLLNTILTVKEGKPLSHASLGWEIFTENALEYLVKNRDTSNPLAVILWGGKAAKYRPIFERFKYRGGDLLVLESPHPSPLSAYRGFFGSRPFSKVNDFFVKHKKNSNNN